MTQRNAFFGIYAHLITNNSSSVEQQNMFLGAFATFKSDKRIVMSVRPQRTRLALGRIFLKFAVCVFCGNLSRKCKIHLNLTRVTDNLHGK